MANMRIFRIDEGAAIKKFDKVICQSARSVANILKRLAQIVRNQLLERYGLNISTRSHLQPKI